MNKHQQVAPQFETLGQHPAWLDNLDSHSADEVALLESLSVREIEVLRVLSAGLSNREMASHLYIAVETVKNHLKSIYGKLQVNSRTKAVYRAKVLHLID